MATDTYLNLIANGLKEYDPIKHEDTTFEMYKALAWTGLKKSDRWQNQLTDDDRKQIGIKLFDLVMYTTLDCNN